MSDKTLPPWPEWPEWPENDDAMPSWAFVSRTIIGLEWARRHYDGEGAVHIDEAIALLARFQKEIK